MIVSVNNVTRVVLLDTCFFYDSGVISLVTRFDSVLSVLKTLQIEVVIPSQIFSELQHHIKQHVRKEIIIVEVSRSETQQLHDQLYAKYIKAPESLADLSLPIAAREFSNPCIVTNDRLLRYIVKNYHEEIGLKEPFIIKKSAEWLAQLITKTDDITIKETLTEMAHRAKTAEIQHIKKREGWIDFYVDNWLEEYISLSKHSVQFNANKLEHEVIKRRAYSVYNKGKFECAIALLEDHIEELSQEQNIEEEFWFQSYLGFLWLEKEAFEETKKIFLKQLDLAKDLGLSWASAYAYQNLGITELNRNNIESALEYLSICQEFWEQNTDTEKQALELGMYKALAALHIRENNEKMAINVLKRALTKAKDLEIEEEAINILFALGESYSSLDRQKKAKNTFRKAISLIGSDQVRLHDVLHELIDRGFSQAATACAETGATIQSEDFKITMCFSRILLVADRINSSLKLFYKTISLQPDDVEVWWTYGQMLIENGYWENAISFFYKAIERNSNESKFWYGLGKAQYKINKRIAEALESLLTASSLDPRDPLIHHDLGHIYADIGDLKRCDQEFEKAYELDPEDVGILQCWGEIYEERGEFEKAGKIRAKGDKVE